MLHLLFLLLLCLSSCLVPPWLALRICWFAHSFCICGPKRWATWLAQTRGMRLRVVCARAVAGGCILATLACLVRLRTGPPWGKTSRAASAGHVCWTMDFVMISAHQIRELASPIHRISNHPANATFCRLSMIAASNVYCILSLCIWCCRLHGRNMDYESRLLASTTLLRGGR